MNVARIARVVGVVGLLAGAVLAVPSVAGADSGPIWGEAVPATFATDIQNAAPTAQFNSVSCTSNGYCTAAGNFKDQGGNTQAFTQTSTGGTWGNAVPATFATNVQYAAPDARFDSVSCASTGNCTAAGRFKDLAGNLQAFTQTSTGGTWAQAVPTTFAADIQSTAPIAYFNRTVVCSARLREAVLSQMDRFDFTRVSIE